MHEYIHQKIEIVLKLNENLECGKYDSQNKKLMD